ncbi:MAG: hypothetical protein CME71_02130 [Halobacteriovorax sp.]|nr:hypothetical protein [Halobacteriovorax sp.]
MVIRPKSLEYIAVQVNFRGLLFETLEIDLAHINKYRRSSFRLKDIVYAAKTMLHQNYFEANSSKQYEKETCHYYVIIERFNGSFYKLVFCVCSDRPKNIGINTFYRIKS